jgi:hypothetical protein
MAYPHERRHVSKSSSHASRTNQQAHLQLHDALGADVDGVPVLLDHQIEPPAMPKGATVRLSDRIAAVSGRMNSSCKQLGTKFSADLTLLDTAAQTCLLQYEPLRPRQSCHVPTSLDISFEKTLAP